MEMGDKLGIEVFASVFNLDGARFLQKHNASAIKFAYSQAGLLFDARVRDIAASIGTVYVSLGVMSQRPPITDYISLYCIPEYPVKCQLDFEGIFPMFDGFSSHCLGIEQDLRAFDSGANYLEKHFTLDRNDIDCPDHQFALKPRMLDKLCKALRD
jgi:N-acetylneuraminate synthase